MEAKYKNSINFVFGQVLSRVASAGIPKRNQFFQTGWLAGVPEAPQMHPRCTPDAPQAGWLDGWLAATLTTMHDDNDNEYDDFWSISPGVVSKNTSVVWR